VPSGGKIGLTVVGWGILALVEGKAKKFTATQEDEGQTVEKKGFRVLPRIRRKRGELPYEKKKGEKKMGAPFGEKPRPGMWEKRGVRRKVPGYLFK